jgi:hypothetical protein
MLITSVADPDPDPPDPRVFWASRIGSGSTSQRYGVPDLDPALDPDPDPSIIM